MSRSKIFVRAWKLARKGANKFGGSAREYFADSLRRVYAANAARSTINNVRYEALRGKPTLSPGDAVELATYHAAEALAMSLLTMHPQEHLEMHQKYSALIPELAALYYDAIISNSYTNGIVIMRR